MISGANIIQSLCTPQGDLQLSCSQPKGTQINGTMKMKQCLFFGQMTPNGHRRDDRTCKMKIFSTQKKKKKHHHKLHKLVLAYKANPFPFCPLSLLGNHTTTINGWYKMGRNSCCGKGPFFFLEHQTWSGSAFVKQPFYLHNRKETWSSFSRWALPLVGISCLTSLEWSDDTVAVSKIFPDNHFPHLLT